MMMSIRGILVCSVIAVVSVAGCGPGPSDRSSGTSNDSEGNLVRIAVDNEEAERLLRFYFGSFMEDGDTDPVAAGILEKREKTWYLRAPDSVDTDRSELLAALFGNAKQEGFLSEDMLEAFVQRTYYDARRFPETLDTWKVQHGTWSEPGWFRLEVQGSMVPQRRVTWVRRAAVEAALDGMQTLDDPILYPVGTVFVGEHVRDGLVEETTLMQKRADGFWDYWAYDGEGLLTDIIRKEPRDMHIPIRCTGCHFGDRQFEPERSFPSVALPGPSGERVLHVPEPWRRSDLVASMQEHARRSDTILGLYATLYLAEAATGTSPSPESARRYVERFGIEPSPQ